MARRLADAISRALTPPRREREQPHFHQGAQGNVAACFAARCDRPRLEA